MRAGAALGAGALSVVLIAFALMAAVVVNERRPAVLAQKLRPGAREAIRKLIDSYSMECHCEKGKKCDCAAKAANDVRAALRNAVDRQFAPPNMYYRSKDGYAFRLRGFQKPQPPVHVERPAPAPVQVYRRPTQPPAEPKPIEQPKPVVVNGLPPVPVSSRFVNDVSPEVFSAAHASWHPSQGAAAKVQYSSKAKSLRTTKLYELPMLAQQGKAESEEESDEDEEFYNSDWFGDWMDYSKLILSNGPLEEAEQQEAHLPVQPTAAVELPYQLGQEVDFADWDAAWEEDAVAPLRVVDGVSTFPAIDSNDDFTGAVLVDYGGESPDREAYANFLVQEAEAKPSAPTSADGWLRDSPGYND